jgi:putative CocE/NonD family hydrolase
LLQRVAYGKEVPGVVNGALNITLALRRGYNVVIQDSRGTGRSSGRFVPFEHEAMDGCTTIEWIRSQSWAEPEVCTFGRSYAGMNQWLLARAEPPGLVAIAPMLSGDALDDGWLSRDGVLEYGFVLLWCARSLAAPILTHEPHAADPAARALLAELGRVVNLGERFYEQLPSSLVDSLVEILPMLGESLGKDGTVQPAPTETRSPVPFLMISGWYDIFAEGCIRTFERVDRPAHSRLVMGPWAHGGSLFSTYPTYDFGLSASGDGVGVSQIQLDFFDQCLGRADTRDAEEPAVRYFTGGRNSWSTAPTWPPPGAVTRTLFLTASGGLDSGEPASDSVTLEYDLANPVPTVGGQTFLPGMEVGANSGPTDQSSLRGRDDVLWFVGELLEAPLELAGRMELRLSLEPHSSSSLLCARVVDISPEGPARIISEGARHWDGHESSAGVVVGSTAHVLDAGHRLGVLVSTSSWPRFAAGAPGTATNEGQIRVRVGTSDGSMLTISELAPQ